MIGRLGKARYDAERAGLMKVWLKRGDGHALTFSLTLVFCSSVGSLPFGLQLCPCVGSSRGCNLVLLLLTFSDAARGEGAWIASDLINCGLIVLSGTELESVPSSVHCNAVETRGLVLRLTRTFIGSQLAYISETSTQDSIQGLGRRALRVPTCEAWAYGVSCPCPKSSNVLPTHQTSISWASRGIDTLPLWLILRSFLRHMYRSIPRSADSACQAKRFSE